jgi:hypothetical protein
VDRQVQGGGRRRSTREVSTSFAVSWLGYPSASREKRRGPVRLFAIMLRMRREHSRSQGWIVDVRVENTRNVSRGAAPNPVLTAMYCLPFTLYDKGKPCTEAPRRVSHDTLLVFTSTARNIRSMSPTNATPPVVDHKGRVPLQLPVLLIISVRTS